MKQWLFHPELMNDEHVIFTERHMEPKRTARLLSESAIPAAWEPVVSRPKPFHDMRSCSSS